MTRRVLISLAMVVVILVMGASAAAWLISHKPEPESTVPIRPPLIVSAIRVEPRTIVEPILGFGTARSDRHARISTQVVGEIVELGQDVQEGAGVDKGQVLVRIDDREYQAQLKRARSALDSDQAQLEQLDKEETNLQRLIDIAEDELEIAEREYDRVRDLIERSSANPREFDAALGDLQRARRILQTLENQKAVLPDRKAAQRATCELRRAEVALAELNVERCTILAPFDGRLNKVQAQIGERVAPGDPLCTLVDPMLIEVPIELPISVRGSLDVDAECELTIESLPGVRWTGRIKRIAPVASAATRSFKVFVEIDNRHQPQLLMPGAFVRAKIGGLTFENATVIPRGSIENGRVFVYSDGAAVPRDVTVVRHLLDQTIVKGLEPGELVITSNLDSLKDNTAVRLRGGDGAGETP